MKAAILVCVLLITALLVNFLRAGAEGFPIVRCLPFSGGHPPGIYDAAAVVVLILAARGFARIFQRSEED